MSEPLGYPVEQFGVEGGADCSETCATCSHFVVDWASPGICECALRREIEKLDERAKRHEWTDVELAVCAARSIRDEDDEECEWWEKYE